MLNYKKELTPDQLKLVKGRDGSVLCYSYISKNQIFTEEQIEEMIVITSPLFSMMKFSLSEPKCVEAVKRIIQAGYDDEAQKKVIFDILEEEKGKKSSEAYTYFLSRLREASIPKGGFQDKLDWTNIKKYQKLSPKFNIKWRDVIRSSQRESSPHTKNSISSTPYRSKSIIYGKPLKAKLRGKY